MATPPPHTTSVLAVSGSLRHSSSNTRLLELVAELAVPALEVRLFHGIADLPHFNPDIDREEDPVPEPVATWRSAIRASEGMVISCPEYAHGVPGSFKNALDWLVSSADLLGRPVLILNASPAGGEFAQTSLTETLTMLGGLVLPQSRLAPFLPATFWRARDEATVAALKSTIDSFASAARDASPLQA